MHGISDGFYTTAKCLHLLPLFTWEKGAAKIENKDSTKGLQAPQGNTSICAEIQLSKPKPTPETNL